VFDVPLLSGISSLVGTGVALCPYLLLLSPAASLFFLLALAELMLTLLL
jgi:hypothetical protein